MIPAFHLHLNEKIQRGQATVGKYDGQHSSLTCATLAGKVFLHSPHGPGDSHITYLNINKQVTALVAGCLPAGKDGRDVLLVGTPTTLQCYDVQQNKDLFFKDVTDGVNVVVVGTYGSAGQTLALVGGNCTIQGYDSAGSEILWTVTGDNVSSMTLCDVDGDGQPELLVGSDDFDLRVFRNEDILAEVSEADQFVGLCPVHLSHFGYALVNGTIGVYDRLDRIWRVKSKHSVCAVAAFDLDGDGVKELISGWSNGRVEVRREDTGEVVFRDHLSSAVSGIMCADYRSDGQEEVIVCSMEGEVRGYLPMSADQPQNAMDFSAQQAAITELTQCKQELLYELTSYQNTKASSAQAEASGNMIPSTTKVDSFVTLNKDTCTCELGLKTNNSTVIRGAVVFGEQIFAEESLFIYPKTAESSLSVPLRPVKDVAVVLMIKVLVGTRSSSVYHIFELEIELPKFAMYAAVERSAHKTPASSVTFSLTDRIPRILAFVESRFNTKLPLSRMDGLEACFTCLRDRSPLIIRAIPLSNTTQVTILTDNMDVAGEVVNELASYLGLADLASTADYPLAMEAFRAVLAQVEAHNATRLRMNADMADSSNLVKQLLIKAEDMRLLGNMTAMKAQYKRLHDLNKDLMVEHDKRATNHTQLLSALKEVNLMIQRAARLRVGAPKARVSAACRAAIKEENMAALFRIIKDGDVR
ncbi:BBS2m [Haematococcus lacustris]